MSIRIDKEKCIGCGRCAEMCPGTLINLENKKAVMKYPKDCWGCASCLKECPVGAVEFFLGADIGGTGSVMNVTPDGDILRWKIKSKDGTATIIDLDRKDSNKY